MAKIRLFDNNELGIVFIFAKIILRLQKKENSKNEKKMCIKSIFCDRNTKSSRNKQKLDEKDQNT